MTTYLLLSLDDDGRLTTHLQSGGEIRYYYMQGCVGLFPDPGFTMDVATFLQLRANGTIKKVNRRDGQWTDRGAHCDVYKLRTEPTND